MSDGENTPGKHRALKEPWKEGQSGNPAGRPKGSRNKLGEAFIEALHDDFNANGIVAIETMRAADPGGYVRVIAGLLPKEFKIETTSDLTDEQLDARIRTLANLVEIGIGQPAGGAEASEGSATAH
ncbi:MAG: DUF5681 domain-containing protein [Phycisphaerales bacterium]|jgi:hypothetical protein